MHKIKIIKIKYCISLIITILASNNLYAATKTFEREYTYRASDVDSKVTSRDNAVNELRKILLREVGEYIRAERRSINGEYSEDMEGITAGIVEMKILNEEWDGKYYYVKARMSVDPAEVNRRIEQARRDKQKDKEIQEERSKRQQVEAENKRLRKKIESSDNKQTIPLSNAGFSTINYTTNISSYKSPTLAFLMDCTLPGLGGWYVDRKGDAGLLLAFAYSLELGGIFGGMLCLFDSDNYVHDAGISILYITAVYHIFIGAIYGIGSAMEAYNLNKRWSLFPDIKAMNVYHANAVSYGITFTISF